MGGTVKLLIWTDGEMSIIHQSRCKCGFCKLERIIETTVKVKSGWWEGAYRNWKHVLPN